MNRVFTAEFVARGGARFKIEFEPSPAERALLEKCPGGADLLQAAILSSTALQCLREIATDKGVPSTYSEPAEAALRTWQLVLQQNWPKTS